MTCRASRLRRLSGSELRSFGDYRLLSKNRRDMFKTRPAPPGGLCRPGRRCGLALGTHLCRRDADHAAGHRCLTGCAGELPGRRSRHHRRTCSLQDSVNQVGQEMTRRNLNIQPTVTSRLSLPVRIIVARDLGLHPIGRFFRQGDFMMSTTKKMRLGPLPRCKVMKPTFAYSASLKADVDRYAVFEAFMAVNREFRRKNGRNKVPVIGGRPLLAGAS